MNSVENSVETPCVCVCVRARAHTCMLRHFNRVQLCNPMDYSSPGSSVGGIPQAVCNSISLSALFKNYCLSYSVFIGVELLCNRNYIKLEMVSKDKCCVPIYGGEVRGERWEVSYFWGAMAAAMGWRLCALPPGNTTSLFSQQTSWVLGVLCHSNFCWMRRAVSVKLLK